MLRSVEALGAAPMTEAAQPPIAVLQVGVSQAEQAQQPRRRVGQAIAAADESRLPLIAVEHVCTVQPAILDDAIHVGEMPEGRTAGRWLFRLGGGASRQQNREYRRSERHWGLHGGNVGVH